MYYRPASSPDFMKQMGNISRQPDMENTVIDFMHLGDSSGTSLSSINNKTSYVSFIKINGKPILPPLIDDEKRKELQKFKQKAIELELKLANQKRKTVTKIKEISNEVSSIANAPPSHQSTPTRPATLNLTEKGAGKMFLLSKSRTDGSLNKYTNNMPLDCEIFSSHKSAKNLDRAFRSTLEQRIASEDVTVRNKSNTCHQSPISEEHFPDVYPDSENEGKGGKQIWSPLQIDSINSLKIELPTKDTHEIDENLEISLDESQNTPETVTHSPNLMRQNSYTLLTPSPALLQFLESQKEQEPIPRSQSGRRTWDLTNAKKNWDPKMGKSSDEEGNEENEGELLNKRNSSSLESLSAVQNNSSNEPDYCEYSLPNSLAYDSGTSPESFNSKRSISKVSKVKHKVKGKKARSTISVPSPIPVDKVPFKDHTKPTQGFPDNFPGPEFGEELSDLSNLLLRMKVDFERQKKELEEKQQSEMKRLEILFQRKEAELLNRVGNLPRKSTKSIYTESCRGSWPRGLGEAADGRMMGDGNHSRADDKTSHSASEQCLSQYGHGRRPHSAKDFHPKFYSFENDCNRRTKSMDFNQGNQDTDLDVSFQDFIQSRDATLNNEYIIESDSISNFSSQSSTVSSDIRHDLAHPRNLKKFQGISSEEYVKYNQAASRITAAARGFLTRRLFRTAHVQGLITTLRDAINCATQLHTASDIADSDIDLMRRLSRQIEAAWDAVYAVFFNTETTTKLQLIAADRERLRAAVAKTPAATVKKKRISSATRKSLDRKKGGSVMSKSQTSNGFGRVRMCTKMAASYPSPYFPQKLK